MLQHGVVEVAHGHFYQNFCIGTVRRPSSLPLPLSAAALPRCRRRLRCRCHRLPPRCRTAAGPLEPLYPLLDNHHFTRHHSTPHTTTPPHHHTTTLHTTIPNTSLAAARMPSSSNSQNSQAAAPEPHTQALLARFDSDSFPMPPPFSQEINSSYI